MSSHNFCHPTVMGYGEVAKDSSDGALDDHLFKYYPTMTPGQWADPMYRKWRRCVIVESLRRGLIRKDPGMGEPRRPL